MRVLFTSIRNAGHFNPLVPLVQACLRAGHEVAVASAKDLEAPAKKSGAQFFEVDHPGDAALRPIWAKLPTLPPEEASKLVISEIFARMNGGAALPKLLSTIEAWKPGVVVREGTEFAGAVAAEAHGVPHARFGIVQSALETQARRWASEAVDELRARAGLPPDPAHAQLDRAPYLTLFPAIFEDPAKPGVEDALRFRVPADQAAPALPDHWWPNQSGPFVYVTFGSVAGGMPGTTAAYRAALDAVAPLDARVLLTTGLSADIEAIGAIPPNVRVERWVPQQDILEHAALVVGHGGSGTTLGTLAAGVPMVVVPLFADQPQNAARVAQLGAGLAVTGKPLSADAIRAAILEIIEHPKYRAGAQVVAKEIAALPPIDAAVGVLEKLAAR